MSLHHDPDARPFRLLDLPAELRNRIYEFMVVRSTISIYCLESSYDEIDAEVFDTDESDTEEPDTEKLDADEPFSRYVLYTSRNRYGHMDDHPLLNICQVNHQVLKEVMPLFYGNTTFEFGIEGARENDFSAVTRFFNDRPNNSLSMIRSLALHIFASTDTDGQTFLIKGALISLKELCKFISCYCKLRHLRLTIFVRSFPLEKSDYRTARTLLDTPGIHAEIPEWIQELGAVKNLESLGASFEFKGSTTFLTQSIAALKFMRSVMVQGGDRMTGKEGIRVSLMHALYHDETFEMRSPWRTLYCSLEVQRCRSAQKQCRRVKVDPNGWCKRCGKFLKRRGCDCEDDDSTRTDRYRLGTAFGNSYGNHDPYTRIETNPSNYHETTQKNSLSGYDIRNNQTWGGGPLTDHLSEGITVEDYQYAQSVLEAGVSICLNQITGVDSDFGDTDSVLSIHDWIDRTEERGPHSGAS